MVKVLYIFAGVNRHVLEKKVEAGESPDTSFLGFMHLKKNPRIDASYVHIGKESYNFLGSVIRKFSILRGLYVALILRRRIFTSDVVVITSSAFFMILLAKKLGFFKRQKFIIFNLDLTVTFTKLKSEPIRYKFLLSTLKEAERIICISEAQKKFLIEIGVDLRKPVFIPLGVDKSFYKPIETQGDIILTIGRDIGRHFETFIEAVRISGKKAVMICSPYNIAGMEEKIPKNLTVLFDQPYTVLREYYKKAKVFAIATKPGGSSIGSDCPGQTSILDTLAYGMPVVATHMSWFDGYFESGKHLIIVPPRDPKALSQALDKVVSDFELRERLSKESRRLIEEKCNSESMAREIAKIILQTA